MTCSKTCNQQNLVWIECIPCLQGHTKGLGYISDYAWKLVWKEDSFPVCFMEVLTIHNFQISMWCITNIQGTPK